MAEERLLSLDQIRGMTVLRSDTGAKAGEVADVIVHPTEGKVLGLAIRDLQEDMSTLDAKSFFIGVDAVMVMEGAHFEKMTSSGTMNEGVPAASRLVGANVVTESGELVGRVSNIYISTKEPRTVYQVAESALQRFLGGGYFIPGNTPRAMSPDGVRMIVPADIEEHYATSSVREALERREGE